MPRNGCGGLLRIVVACPRGTYQRSCPPGPGGRARRHLLVRTCEVAWRSDWRCAIHVLWHVSCHSLSHEPDCESNAWRVEGTEIRAEWLVVFASLRLPAVLLATFGVVVCFALSCLGACSGLLGGVACSASMCKFCCAHKLTRAECCWLIASLEVALF